MGRQIIRQPDARATFALIVHDGRVVDAAPYGRWYIGWTEERAAAALRKAGATFQPLPRRDERTRDDTTMMT